MSVSRLLSVGFWNYGDFNFNAWMVELALHATAVLYYIPLAGWRVFALFRCTQGFLWALPGSLSATLRTRAAPSTGTLY
jgi:hypothetical protein